MTIRLKSDNRIPLSRVFLLGLAAGFLSLAPAILPWGGRFVTRGDFIEQQLPFLLEARRILHGGLNAYSFSTFLGAPALGSYAFYTLGSPFVWPLALLSPAAIPYGISVMAVLKHACALLFAFLWLRRVLRRDDHALLCAFLYAFSSFSARFSVSRAGRRASGGISCASFSSGVEEGVSALRLCPAAASFKAIRQVRASISLCWPSSPSSHKINRPSRAIKSVPGSATENSAWPA